ncbi:MAG: phage holin family protein [Nitrospirota bacterium]
MNHRSGDNPTSSPIPRFLILWALNTLGLWVADYVFDGMRFDSTGALWVSGLLLGLVNAVIRPVLILFTLPLTVFTLGFFLLVINALMVLLVATLVSGFYVADFWTGFLVALFLSVFGWGTNLLLGRYTISVRST